ncbi:hypothetical protein LZ92_23875 [Salmonella enterica]|nr:hypothetical protein [Salmonella enterica subsp. enterica serovar Newport]EBP1503273.1 hypothetical protein [Salmonella enterica]
MTKRSDIAVLSTRSSQKATVQGLLNCLVREFALPLGAVEYTWPLDMTDCVEEQSRKKDEFPLHIRLPGERQFLVMVDRCDVLGSQRYLSDVMVKIDNGHWYTPSFAELIEHILKACGNISGHYNDELAEQIFQSQALVKLILEHNLSGNQHAPLSSYGYGKEQDSVLRKRLYLCDEQHWWAFMPPDASLFDEAPRHLSEAGTESGLYCAEAP